MARSDSGSRHRRHRSRAPIVACMLLVALLGASAADARTESLRWMNADSDPARLDGYRVYTGPSSGSYDEVIDLGLIEPDAQGQLSYDLAVPDGATVYLVMTAYDGALESAYSNEKVFAPPSAVTTTDATVAAGVGYLQADEASFPTGSEAEHLTGGAAAGDYDGDGWVDLYVTQLDAPDALFRNQGDGTFVDVAAAAGLGLDLASNGAGWADVDNDGDLDLYVTTLGPSENRFYLFINDGAGHFSEEAVARGADVSGSDSHYGFSVAFGDYDGDGWTDIHTSEWRPAEDNPQGALSNARLLRNRGAAAPGFFDDVTQSAGVALDGVVPSDPDAAGTFALASRFTDMDGDGWTDLLIAGDFGTSRLFWNNGDGTFTDGTAAAGVGTEANGMGMAVGDYDGDGDPDWFVTGLYDPDDPCNPGATCLGATGNRLHRNDGGGAFSDQTDTAGVRDGYWGSSAAFYDMDNDGDLDLVMTNGASSGTPLARFAPDPMRVWQNDGSGAMTEVSASTGMTDDGPGRGLLTFDYDRDGDLDVFIVNNAGSPVLYRNDTGNQNSWLRIDTVGTDSNRDGLGAIVSVWTASGGSPLVREISSGSHFLGQSETIAHFGLGAGTAPVDRVTVYWPATGRTSELSAVARNQSLVVIEPPAIDPPLGCPGGDSDGDGMCDAVDNCTVDHNPDQTDTDGDGYGNACDTDFTNDGVVGGQDFGVLAAAFGHCEGDPEYAPAVDTNADGCVGAADLAVFGRQFADSAGGGASSEGN